MTASPRPNLGGLFNGSTPPERSSTIAEALGPRGVRLTAVVDDTDSASAGAPAAPEVEAAAPQPVQGSGTAQEYHWPAPNWLNPVTVVEHYFAFLHTLLDANQRLAMSMAGTLVSLPHRAKIWH